MKKAKFTLGLLTVAISAIGLSACNKVSAKEGAVLTFKTVDPVTGKSVNVPYYASELFESYRQGTSAASTSFNKVYEVLIRKYYNTQASTGEMRDINKAAQNAVNSVKQQASENADSNGTTYEEEFEKLLNNFGVDNVDELFALKQYDEERDRFEKKFYDSNTEAMRDGYTDGFEGSNPIFPTLKDNTKAEDKGYLREKMPYHVSHILAKIDGDSSLTSASISDANAVQIGTIIEELAGDTTGDRQGFGEIASSKLNDDTSKKDYGDLGIMDKDTEFVPEFKLGLYAYDAIYNKATSDYRTANKATLLPSEDATFNAGDETVINYFTNLGIGKIPYGAAKALLSTHDLENADGVEVNGNSSHFYPRNIIFNKYFNKRNIAVIVPEDIPYNTVTTFDDSTIYDGTLSATTASTTYAALPGFSVDTTSLIDVGGGNVLTDTKGRIILAVRAASSGYQGIHFIVADRSALDAYGSHKNADGLAVEYTKAEYEAQLAEKDGWKYSTTDQARLDEYYPAYFYEEINQASGNNGYPAYSTDNGATWVAKTTYNNNLVRDATEAAKRRDTVTDKFEDYNSNVSTYIFQSLLSEGSITYSSGATWLKDQIELYIQTQRESSQRDKEKDFNDDWIKYAEALAYQEEVRNEAAAGTGALISETCAIGFTSDDAKAATGIFAKGGVCGVK